MTQQEINTMIDNMIETKCIDGLNRMKKMPTCQRIFKCMSLQGFTKEAQIFKSIVFYSTIIHSDWNEKEIITDFAKEVGIIK